jgi:hypothetical protein
MCVRTCDGFYFPLSVSFGDDGEACRELCPGAPMDVYRQSRGSDDMEDAVSTKGRRYSSLAAAFLYRKELKAGCSCGRSKLTASEALRRDDTLKSGDVVMTERGVRVFNGREQYPHRESAFLPLTKAHGLPKTMTDFLSLIDKPFRHSELKDSLTAPVKAALLAD